MMMMLCGTSGGLSNRGKMLGWVSYSYSPSSKSWPQHLTFRLLSIGELLHTTTCVSCISIHPKKHTLLTFASTKLPSQILVTQITLIRILKGMLMSKQFKGSNTQTTYCFLMFCRTMNRFHSNWPISALGFCVENFFPTKLIFFFKYRSWSCFSAH